MISIRLSIMAAIVTSPLMSAGSATATDEGCLHRADFRAVESSVLDGAPMNRAAVHRVFGINGQAIGDNTRVYPGCGEGSRAWVQYELDNEGTWRASSTAFTWAYFGDGLTTLHPA